MRRRKEGGLDLIAAMPWPIGLVLGVVAYLAIRYGIGWYFSQFGGPMFAGLGESASAGAFAPLAWMVLTLCWIAAAASYFKARSRRRLLDTRNGLQSLADISWREFEMLVGEAFRRQGYSVEENGLGGADGGIDLVLRKDGRRTLVQCKQWKRQRVDVRTVREMYGLLAHHDADAIKIVTTGSYTPDAARFADGKPIELIAGAALLQMVEAGQAVARPGAEPGQASSLQPSMATPGTSAPCPACGGDMIPRKNRQSGASFLGCQQYPRCRGTRPL